jgi:hypothetical protein
MRLVQFRRADGRRAVAGVTGQKAHILAEVESVYELALEAIETDQPLVTLAKGLRTPDQVSLDELETQGRLLPPIDHPVPTRCWVTGTGLTHTGGAEARDQMHRAAHAAPESLTDSMKMFRAGLEGGKPAEGQVGVQPEWFFKGNGSTMVGSGQPLPVPHFALDAGEEPEVVGLYVIADDGTPCRVGYALGNDFSDHVMERENYLLLAHSKLRVCAVGPELLLGELPDEILGSSRIRRAGKVVWEKPFRSGEANMCHSLRNLEHHHFKYPLFRRPGDVHLHFFGASTLSFQEGFVSQPGDQFEISAEPFGRPLRNTLKSAEWTAPRLRVL